jgi:hypothetical protein
VNTALEILKHEPAAKCKAPPLPPPPVLLALLLRNVAKVITTYKRLITIKY